MRITLASTRWPALAAVMGLLCAFAMSADTFAAQPDGAAAPLAASTAPFQEPGGDGQPDGLMPPYPGCVGDLDGVVSGSVVDPSARGFAMNLLGADFQLLSLTLRSQADCDENGQPVNERLVLDTAWLHLESGLPLSLSQQAAAAPTANVLDSYTASFWSDGDAYSASVQSYFGGDPVPVPGEPRGGGMEEPVPGSFPPGEPDPLAREVLLQVIAELAPGVAEECFYRHAEGTWSDLAGLGIGDPRPALPGGYAETSFYLSTYSPPAEGCDSVPLDGYYTQTSFSASFASEGDGGSISIAAYGLWSSGENYPGYIDDYSASWTNSGYQFSVYGDRAGEPLGVEAVRAIALALDPDFASACFFEYRTLSDSDVVALGLNVPVPPSGFSLAASFLTAYVTTGDCGDSGVEDSYSLWWNFSSEAGAVIDASAYRYGGVVAEGAVTSTGWISDYAVYWTDEDGVGYAVSGYTSEGGSVGRALLIEVALSMDPDLDVDGLEEGGDGGTELPPKEPRF